MSESTHNVLEFYTALTLTNVEAASLEKETTGQQQNRKWWTARKTRVTASRFGDICKELVIL